ncbi:MAG: hypothetical protein OXC10_20965 [Rhodospirillaceae bacterium]|nr:hypothetical protein [Rhodospirillaceae bacterium]
MTQGTPRRRIAAMYEGFRNSVYKGPLPRDQATEVRRAFFAGAASLYAIMMKETDDGEEEPTTANLRTMAEIDAELREWGEGFDAEFMPTAGTA